MINTNLFKKTFINLVSLLIFIPICSAAEIFDSYDHIKSFKAILTVSPNGDALIDETLTLFVGEQPAPHSTKVIQGFIREIPPRGPNQGFSLMTIESISCDEIPVAYEYYYTDVNQIAIKIKAATPLVKNQTYTYHLKYRYPGLIGFYKNNEKSLYLAWQMTLKKGLPALKSYIEMHFPNETAISSYHLKKFNDAGIIAQSLVPANYSFEETPNYTTWELNNDNNNLQKIWAEQSKKSLKISIENECPSDLPVAIGLDFDNAALCQAIKQQYLQEKAIVAKPNNYFLASTGLVVLSYFLVLQAINNRQKEFQKKYDGYIGANTYNNLNVWQKNYLKKDVIDIDLIEDFFAQWHYQGLITFEKDSDDSLIMSMTKEQRQRLSAEDLIIAQSLFMPSNTESELVWTKQINEATPLSFHDMLETLHKAMRNKVSLSRFISSFSYYFLAAVATALSVSISDISELFSKNEDLSLVLICSVLATILLQKMFTHIAKSVPEKSGVSKGMSYLGHFSMIGFIIVAFYIMQIGYYNIAAFLILCFFFLVWCAQALEALFPLQLDKIALQDIARRFEIAQLPTQVKASWSSVWPELEKSLMKSKQKEMQDPNNNYIRTPFAYRYVAVPGVTGVPASRGSFGGGGSARGC